MATENNNKSLNHSVKREQSEFTHFAECENERGSSLLNVPNKGEQSQTCLSYADRAEQSPQGNVPNKRAQSQVYLNYAEHEEHLHKENVPNLRFPEFSGEWEQSRLNRFASKITKKNKGNTISNVLSNSANYGIIPQIDFFDRSIANSDNTEGYYVIEKNDFVYNPRKSASAPYGPINVYNGEACGIISPLYLCFKVKGINRRFLYHYFKSTKWHPYMYANGDSGARHDRVSIKDETFLELPIFHPGEAEQCKIVELVESLDNRIATQIKIIEDLKKLKSAISNEIFNHTSNRKCELKEIASVIMGQSPSSHAYNNNADGLPLIQGNLDIENGQLSPRIYTSEITQTCECGDVILTVRAPVGEIAIAQQEACIGRGVCSIRPHVNNDTNLIYQFLQYFKPKWGSLEQGSTFTAVSGTDIRGIAVSIPSADKIELLNVYDNKIRVESRILTNLTQQKQYLLAQMFI